MTVMTNEQRCEHLVDLIKSYRYTYTDEYGLQQQIFDMLTQAGYPATREKFIRRIGRLDLAVGPIAIEVKVYGAVANLIRQVARYLGSPEIQGVVVVSTVARHGSVPATIKGKPVRTALLLGDLQ